MWDLFAVLARDFRPVDDVPPCRDVVGTAVLVLQVVGVLPDVEPENRLLAVHDRVVLVGRALDRQLAAVVDQPGPPAAEAADTCLRELLLERVESAKRRLDRVRQRAGRLAARIRRHLLPERGGSPAAPAVVPD